MSLPDGEPYIDWVPSALDCGSDGGFYYDPPLEQGIPERLVLCPESCELFGLALQRNIKVLTDCSDPSAR